jgi:hypothetical protein
VWIGSYTVTLGSWHIGVRVDDVDVRDFLVARLGDALQPSASPPPGYAVVTTNVGSNGIGRELPSLRFGQAAVLRSRWPLRLAQALVNHLHSHPDPPPGTLRLRTAALIHAGSAVLLPERALWAGGTERQLAKMGLFPVDSPIVDVDPTGRVRLESWAWGESAGSEPMEVSAWLLEEHLLGELDPSSRSSELAAASNLIVPTPSLDSQGALNGIAHLLPIIEPIGADWSIGDIAESAEMRTHTS